MNDGWIKLYRSTFDNPIVNKDPDHLSVWLYLLCSATHKGYSAMFRKNRIELQPGQLLTGRKSIARQTGVEEHKVDRILKLFKSEQQIEQQMSNHNRLITILNWNKYQQSEQQIEHQVSNKWASSEQQVSTNKNVKNVNNEKKVKNTYTTVECSEGVPEQIKNSHNAFVEAMKKRG